MAVADYLGIKINLSRDNLLDDFSQQTLKERYLFGDETSPQHAFARAAVAFCGGDMALAQRLYDYVSLQYFMFATPLLSNGGTERGLPISCFLNSVEDSREGILTHYTEVGWLASVGGGVGGHWGFLRSNGERTSKGSASTGVIPFQAVVDREIMAFSQGTTRRGSYAAYLDIDHPEIEEFITGRKPTGGDQNRKFTNLHNAVCITDAFMHAVEKDLPFDLVSPKDGSVIKIVKARHLWRLLIETRMQTGEPYMVFIDTINRALPEAQKKLGLKVHQSNLCVAPYTEILTIDGYKPIAALDGKTVSAWNGEEFSSVVVRKTSEAAELIRVWFSDGAYIDCTPEHNFHLADGRKVPAAALKNDDVLEYGMPRAVIDHKPMERTHAQAAAFTAGWATFAGFEDEGRLTIHVPHGLTDEKGVDLRFKTLLTHSVDASEDESGMTIRYEPKTIPSGHVPFEWSVEERREWLRGVIESPAASQDPDTLTITIGSTDVDMIREMRLMCHEIGIQPSVRLTDTMNVLLISEDDLAALWTESYGDAQEIKVADVHPLPFKMATYCATEPKRGRLTFNGYVTGNCTEITLATGRDFLEKMRTAVCCLSSINGAKWDEFESFLDQLVLDLTTMLDNALDVFISDAPPALHAAVYSAMRERSIGLGLLGFQTYLQQHMVSMGSAEARAINQEMFSRLRASANKASLILGAERGEAPDMAGTGERFAHKLAIAPNASSSILCGGVSPSIEPNRANAFLHKTLSGSFPVRNKQLIEVLQGLGIDTDVTWQSIVAHEGSVQQLDIPQNVKDVFRTATEIDQMALVQLAADRAPLICQAQSLNLFFEHDTDAGKLTHAHYMAWKLGVKSLYYLRSTTPKRAENTNTKVERAVVASEPTAGPERSEVASAASAPAEDEGCLACEG